MRRNPTQAKVSSKAWYRSIISVAYVGMYVCLSVCLYVCNTITFESLNVRSSFRTSGISPCDTG